MSKNINYYPGLTLSKEELQFKDYSDKYLSLFVDLIRGGTEDVIFFKNTASFQMEKIQNSPVDLLRINEGFCLFMDINESIADFDFSETLNINEFPDQRFFVKSEQFDIVAPSLSVGAERYIYLKSRIVPAGFKCTVESDGTVTINNGGTIRKSEVGSVIRGSNSGAPTRVRFVKTDYTDALNGNNIFEVNSFDNDFVYLNGNVAAESGEVICVPIGSFDLGVENNLANRALFGFTETVPFLDAANDLNDGANGIIKLGKIVYQTSTTYDIIDERNNNKYVIEIDTVVDLSDYVTKSTNQEITGEKYFRNLVQRRLNSLTRALHIQNRLIDISGADNANDFIVDLQNLTDSIAGFYHSGKPFGPNPLVNIVPGTSIKVRFINVTSNNFFVMQGSNTDGTPGFFVTSQLRVRANVLYTMRFESLSSELNQPRFSLSPTVTDQEVATINSSITGISSSISSINNTLGTKKDKNDFHEELLHSDSSVKIFLNVITFTSSNKLVTVTAEIAANTTPGFNFGGIVPQDYRPTCLTSSYPTFDSIVSIISCDTDGDVFVSNGFNNTRMLSITYLTNTSI